MTIIPGQVLTGQSIPIDNLRFVGCTLIHGVLGYSGGAVEFDQTILRGCKYLFFGEARATVHLLQETGLLPFIQEEWGEFPFEAVRA